MGTACRAGRRVTVDTGRALSDTENFGAQRMDTFDERLAVLCGLLQPHATQGVVVGPETMLASDLGIDSAQLLEVLLEVEDEFDVSIPLNVLPSVQTVNELMNELDKLIEAAG